MRRARQVFRTGVTFLVLLVPGIFSGCGKKGAPPARARGGQPSGEFGAAKVVARVGGQEITKAQLARMVNNYTQSLLRQGQKPPPAFENTVLDLLIESELLYQIGLKIELPDLERKVDEMYEQTVSRYPSELVLAEELARNGVTVVTLRESLKKEAIVNCVLDQEVHGKITVTEEEIEEYYKRNQDKLKKPERIRVRQILIAVSRVATAEQKKIACEKTVALKNRCLKGEDFEALAREYSEDRGSASRGGDLGLIRKGDLLPPLEKVAWSLPPGRLSEPVETRFGYHLVHVDEKAPAGLPLLAEVRDEITAILKAQKAPEKLNRLVEESRKEIKVEKLWKKD